MTGNPDAKTPTGEGPVATVMRDSMNAIRMDFAEANQWVFYGMAIALGIGFVCALMHPGTRVTDEARTPQGLKRTVDGVHRPSYWVRLADPASPWVRSAIQPAIARTPTPMARSSGEKSG